MKQNLATLARWAASSISVLISTLGVMCTRGVVRMTAAPDVCAAHEEDVVHALDRLGAVLRPAQVERQDFGAGDRACSGFSWRVRRKRAFRAAKAQRQVGPYEPGAPGD